MPPRRTRAHIMVIALPAYGHLIPLLTLAKHISDFHDVTFAISKSKVGELKWREVLTDLEGKMITITEIDDGIPDGTEEDYPPPGWWGWMWTRIVPSVEKFLHNILSSPITTCPVTAVISDVFLAPTATVCRDHKVPCYLFLPYSLKPFQNLLHIRHDTPVIEVSNGVLPMRTGNIEPTGQQSPIPGTLKKLGLMVSSNLSAAKGIIVNSANEIEFVGMEEMEKDLRFKKLEIYCIGPLPVPAESKVTGSTGISQSVTTWLDKQAENSVVYVSFSSAIVLTENRVIATANALLMTKKPFIFSLRSQYHHLLPGGLPEKISTQFEDSQSKGLILPWAPQRLILSHRSVAVFVSHCGWNSTTESILTGKPVVAWPIFGDQQYNAELLVSCGMAKMLSGYGIFPEPVQAEEILTAIEETTGWADIAEPWTYINAARAWQEKLQNIVSSKGTSRKRFDELMKIFGVNLKSC